MALADTRAPEDGAPGLLSRLHHLSARLSIIGAGQLLTFIVGIANQIVLARTLEPVGYGQYALVGTSAALLGWFVGLAVNVAAPAWVRGDPIRARTVVGLTGAYLALWGAVAVVVFVHFPQVSARLISPNLSPQAGRWVLLTTVVGLGFAIALGVLLGLGSFIGHAIISTINSAALLALNVRLITISPGERVDAALLNLNIAYGAGILAALVILMKRGALGRGVGWRAILAERRSSTLRLYVANLVRLGFLRAPFYLVDRLLGPRALGVYALADYVMNLVWRPAGIAGHVLLATAAMEQTEADRSMVAWLCRLLSGATALAVLILAAIGKAGVAAVFGHAFRDTYPILLVAAPGIWAYSVSMGIDFYYAAHDYPWVMILAFAAGAIITLLGAPVVHAGGGLIGAAGMYGLGLVVSFAVVASSFVRRTRIPWREIVIPRASDWHPIVGLWRARAQHGA